MSKLYNRIKSVFYIGLVILFAPFAKKVFLKRKIKGFDQANLRKPSDAFVLHSLVFSSAGLEPKKLYKSLPLDRNTKSEHVMQTCSQLDQTGISDLGQVSDDMVSGPFTYVTGSHNKKPRQFLSGMRISDAAESRVYPDDIMQMVGAKGSFFVADTQCLHKGQHVMDGARILVQFLYAKEMFATNPSAIAR